MNPTFSMSPTVDNCRKVGQYKPRCPVRLVADHLKRPLSVAGQMLKPSDSRCPFPLAADISLALYRGGRGDVAEKLRQPIDRARLLGVVPSLDEALIVETEVEGEANAAQMAFAVQHSTGALDTMVRRWEKQVEVLQMAILAARQRMAGA